MMRYLLVSTAAVMTITGAAAIGNAQTQDDKGRGPAAEGTAPGSGGVQRAPGAGEKVQQPKPDRSEQKSEPRRGAERERGGDQRRATERKDQPRSEDRSKSATKPQRDKDQQKSTEQRGRDQGEKKAADQRQRDKDQKKSTEQRGRDQGEKKAADQRQRDKDQKKSTEQRGRDQGEKKAADQRQRDKDQKKSTEQRQRDGDQQRSTEQRQRNQDQKKSAKDPDGKQAGRVQVSEEKRSGVRERLFKETQRVDRIERTRINVSINVGARLPRSIRVHTLPVSIVSFAPAYRGYSYIVLEDETICIVDPQTYVIVDVIPAGSQRAQLALSRDDMHFIYTTVPKRPTAEVRVRLALGAEVPRNVELLAFPEEVIERVPDMRRYRYIVTNGDIVVVDPDDYAVALVINE